MEIAPAEAKRLLQFPARWEVMTISGLKHGEYAMHDRDREDRNLDAELDDTLYLCKWQLRCTDEQMVLWSSEEEISRGFCGDELTNKLSRYQSHDLIQIQMSKSNCWRKVIGRTTEFMPSLIFFISRIG